MIAKPLLAVALGLIALVTVPGARGAEKSLEEGAKAHLEKLTRDELPGVAVLVARDGKVAYQGAFGFADLEKKTPVTLETKFRIGSVSKQFTAAAILRLADDGKLALTDKVEKFFPGFPRASEITVAQLLTHTSGIASYTEKAGFMERVTKPIAPAELIAWFRDEAPTFAPGAGFRYNNSAYFLAAEIVAKVTGKSFGEYLREAFFEPLGMKDTGVFVNANPPPGMALGYSMIAGKAAPALDWDMSWATGAGSLYSTVGDLNRWNEALYGGKVLKPESLKAMTTPVQLPPGTDGMTYGYGVLLAPLHWLPSISHSGGLNGWSSYLIWMPEQRCTVVALANALPAVERREPAAIAKQILGKFLQAEIAGVPPTKEDPAFDKKKYPDYAGRYNYQDAVLTVTAEDGHLRAQLTGQEKFDIFPSGSDAFFWKVTDARVKFLRDEKGVVIAAEHSQGGATHRAPRVKEPAVKLTAGELDAILGRYQYGPGAILNVTRDGDSVFAQMTGQPKYEIFPKSKTEFEWRIVPASVKFDAGKDGKVSKAVHTQNGATFDAPKIQ